MRDKYKGHEFFEYTAQFCHLYDQCAFDPDYQSMPLKEFEPIVHRVLSKPKKSIYKY
jgi:predicted HD phosphohydrolase